MINPKTLKKLGVTKEALKGLFTPKVKVPHIQKIVDRISDRVQVGVDNNMRDWRVFYAIDKAYDTPFYQSSHSLLQGLADGKIQTNDVLAVMKDLGIQNIGISCSCKKPDCSDPQCTGKKSLDIPAFFEVLVPIVRAYVNIRWARIYNDHNLVPLHKYEPSQSTTDNRLKCAILTQRAELQSNQMNHRAYLRQAILQSLQYSTCLMFPREAWWYDQQPGDDGKKKTEREGIRYDLPHPSRFYYDLAHPIFTLNSDTGCTHAGYWQLVPYGDIADNEAYWNRTSITFGADSFKFHTANKNYFSLVYPCAMSFPDFKSDEPAIAGTINQEERFRKYGRNDHDKAVMLTNHFELLNPLKDLKLKNADGKGYDGKVWLRFQIASDDTVIFCEPLAYPPVRYFGCDVDASRARNVGLALEVVPYQTMIGNFLSQSVLTAKNNLTKVVFVNTDVIDQSVMTKLENIGEKRYRKPIIVPYSRHESTAQNVDHANAVHEINLTTQSVAESIGMIKTLLDILERVLVMSSQEMASSASHEQSATEVGIVAQSTSTRLAFTSGFIDDGLYAWGLQIAQAGMAYWDDEIFAQIAIENDADKKKLEALGFKVEDSGENDMTVGVRGSKAGLDVDGFTVRRDAADRVNSSALAAQMVQLFQVFIGNPLLIKTVGVRQVVETFNKIASISGLPRDYRLNAISDPFKDMPTGSPEEQSKAVEAQLAAILPQAMAKVQADTIAKIGEGIKPMADAVTQLMDSDKQQTQVIGQVATVAGETKKVVEQMLQLFNAGQPPAPPAAVLPPA